MWREYKGYWIKTKSCWTVNGANYKIYQIYLNENDTEDKQITNCEKLKDAKAYIDEL